MIHPDDAVAKLAAMRRAPITESVPLAQALGRMLPATVESGLDQPPFDKAAMDGWAWGADAGGALAAAQGAPDAPGAPGTVPGTPGTVPGAPGTSLRAAGIIAAGSASSAALAPGTAARIMTGAPLPPGADRVQRFEWAEEKDGRVVFAKAEAAPNVIRRGENVRRGDVLLTPRLLSAADIGILAADGRDRVDVAARVRVGVLSTGTELVEPGRPLSGAAIYDSNRAQIIAQLASPAFDVEDYGIMPDDFDATLAAVRSALAERDVVILSGGVSMGDFDYVPKALRAAGVETVFHGIAMKPGKPTYFGTDGRAFVFGLPGNPVSVFVNMELLVKELLFALSGVPYRAAFAPMRAAKAISRRGADRVEFLPVRIAPDGVEAVAYGGSSSIQSLGDAAGFVRLEIGQETIEAGETTGVRLVR